MKAIKRFGHASVTACLLAVFPGMTALAAESATLQPFESEAAFRKAIEVWTAESKNRGGSSDAGLVYDAPVPVAPAPSSPSVIGATAAAGASSDDLDRVEVTGSRVKASEDESITNVQTEGVDEGDIVKRRGDVLVVLRRGRLFTIRVGGDSLAPVSVANAYGDGVDPEGAWYDEMLVSGNTVVVIGYSYDRDGTEIGLFDLSDAGRITYRATYHLRSDDYYSSRNYANRLIGDKLIFYSPLHLWFDESMDDQMPGLRQWMPNKQENAKFNRILPATRIYRTPGDDALERNRDPVLHTVSICDLSHPQLSCEATAVLGGDAQVFYVSEDSVFVWTASSYWDDRKQESVATTADVFRIPLNGSPPTAMQASGMPIDQMSFLQKDGFLNVLLGAEAKGQWMWEAERAPGDLSLLRVPLTMFADGSDAAKPQHYRPLRDINGQETDIHNRFIGDWLVVGADGSWNDGRRLPGPAQAIRYASTGTFHKIRVGHRVERIEAIGTDAILVGAHDDELRFTSVALGERPFLVSVYIQNGAEQGDDRSHGFFYRPTADDEGLLGLPIVTENDKGDEAASVLFLRNRSLHLRKAGALSAERGSSFDDGCKASCVDWYGDARPIFIGERVFALLGYELVEGVFDGQRIRERRRVDFSPGQVR